MLKMDETKTIEPTTKNNDNGYTPKGLDKIERAEFAVKRMEEAEKRLDDKIAKLTELEANRLLGGTGGGHIESNLKSKEQIETEQMANDMVKAFK